MKLMETSYFMNSQVNWLCEKIYKDGKANIAWVGDYSDEDNPLLYKKTYGKAVNGGKFPVNASEVGNTDTFNLLGCYLVNHTAKEYLDCEKYYQNCIKNSEDSDWVIHPLPLLTCIGNGKGGGDYRSNPKSDDYDIYVGSWCYDEIEIIPITKMYERMEREEFKEYTELEVMFIEE